MSMKLDWSRTGEGTLEIMQAYLSSVAGDDVARSIEANIHQKVDELSQFPKAGRIVPELSRSDIREVRANSYRIIYQLKPEDSPEVITVMGVVHTSQLLENTSVYNALN